MADTYDAATIAKWFIAWAEAEDAEVSNLKVQKLLYYAQGHYLAETGKPLFEDEIQAWSHGPVVKSVYHELKRYGRGPIPSEEVDFEWTDVDSEIADFLIKVWNTYGPIEAWQLRNMTHETTPWRRHFVPDEHNVVIPQDEIREYFSSLRRANP